MAQYTVEKLIQMGARVITLSDSNGTVVDEAGIDAKKLAYVLDLKNVRRGRIKEYAHALIHAGCYCVSEGANMPSTMDAIEEYLEHNVLFAPAKAANAGGVATSGLEMSQNSLRLSWSREEVEQRLHNIMKSIHKNCLEAAEAYGSPGNYVVGANVAGFLKVAKAMVAYGVV